MVGTPSQAIVQQVMLPGMLIVLSKRATGVGGRTQEALTLLNGDMMIPVDGQAFSLMEDGAF